MPRFSDDEGRLAVEIARRRIESYLSGEKMELPPLPPSFKEKMGVFVTLNTYPGRELRGCIGYPEPVLPLIDALMDAAISAATRDPRFMPVKPREMDSIVVEVTLLTPPEEIRYSDPEELPGKIRIGRDGLIAQEGPFRGLLLPQVPVEWGWDAETFLDQTCIKAGIPPGDWREGRVRFFRFQGEIFAEETPRGEVKRVEL